MHYYSVRWGPSHYHPVRKTNKILRKQINISFALGGSWCDRMRGFLINSGFLSLHLFSSAVDTRALGFPQTSAPGAQAGVNCHLQTHHATGGKPRRTELPKANRCPNLWQAPAPASPRPLASPRPSDLLLRVPAALSCTCRTSWIWQKEMRDSWSHCSSSVLKVAQMKNKQTNLVSFVFLLSVQKCSC